MLVIKRNGGKKPYQRSKIRLAISKANREVTIEEQATGEQIDKICDDIENLGFNEIHVEAIQDYIEDKLMLLGLRSLAKKYIIYRYNRMLTRKANTTDNSILNLVRNKNQDVMRENSNKDAYMASTQRDLIAGEVSKDLTWRVLLPKDVVEAHEQGVLHFHDADYFLQPIPNCCLINIKDMLDNGTMLNGVLIETPKSFRVACNVMTQIIAAVASNQYGGQSVAIKHLGKYLRLSYERYLHIMDKYLSNEGVTEEDFIMDATCDEDKMKARGQYELFLSLRDDLDTLRTCTGEQIGAMKRVYSKVLLRKELEDGVQTIQYQINTLLSTNGQSPFLTLFLQLDDNDNYIEEVAMIVEEIIKQRIQGVKNKNGVYTTPAFPKLVYVLDENNCLKGGKYDYITQLCIDCNIKRIYPDYISAKVMRRLHDNEVYSPMGCRSLLSEWKNENGDYVWESRFNQGVVSINLPQIGLLANGDMDLFWEELEKRLALCFKALICRHKALEGTISDVSPIHWQNGALARLKEGETIDKLLHGGFSTISLGYIGLYETTMAMLGVSHTTPEGKEFAKKLLLRLREATNNWKAETGLGFGLYGTPAESLCYRFAEIDKKKFGVIEDITDKGYYTNSYHIDVREPVNAFDKFAFEAEFQEISSGGCISYVEVPNLKNNREALEELVKYIYDTILYAEFNGKSDYCLDCGYSGEIVTVPDEDNNGELVWECPCCRNRNQKRMIVTRRTCGYLGAQYWNVGKTKEISKRVLHL